MLRLLFVWCKKNASFSSISMRTDPIQPPPTFVKMNAAALVPATEHVLETSLFPLGPTSVRESHSPSSHVRPGIPLPRPTSVRESHSLASRPTSVRSPEDGDRVSAPRWVTPRFPHRNAGARNVDLSAAFPKHLLQEYGAASSDRSVTTSLAGIRYNSDGEGGSCSSSSAKVNKKGPSSLGDDGKNRTDVLLLDAWISGKLAEYTDSFLRGDVDKKAGRGGNTISILGDAIGTEDAIGGDRFLLRRDCAPLTDPVAAIRRSRTEEVDEQRTKDSSREQERRRNVLLDLLPYLTLGIEQLAGKRRIAQELAQEHDEDPPPTHPLGRTLLTAWSLLTDSAVSLCQEMTERLVYNRKQQRSMDKELQTRHRDLEQLRIAQPLYTEALVRELCQSFEDDLEECEAQLKRDRTRSKELAEKLGRWESAQWDFVRVLRFLLLTGKWTRDVGDTDVVRPRCMIGDQAHFDSSYSRTSVASPAGQNCGTVQSPRRAPGPTWATANGCPISAATPTMPHF